MLGREEGGDVERAYLPRSIPAPEEPKREKENWTPREYWQTPEESKDDMTCLTSAVGLAAS